MTSSTARPPKTNGRDNLTIDGNAALGSNMALDLPDCAAVLDEFINRTGNLPQEIAHMQEEIEAKDVLMNKHLENVQKCEAALQKWQRTNPNQPNPKEEQLANVMRANLTAASKIQEAKHALSMKCQVMTDKSILLLDREIKKLQDRNEFPDDPELPSLLRPTRAQQRPVRAELPAVMAHHAIKETATPYTRHPNQHPMKVLPPQVQTQLHAGGSSSAAAGPAAILKEQQRQRELSVAANMKRKQNLGGVGISTGLGGSVRHSSATPGTPRAGTPSGGRAGSAGPRASVKGLSNKKVPPQGSKQSGAPRKGKPGKSGLSRVKRTGKNSPSTNDSEASDASGTADEDDEAVTPRAKDADGDEDMVDVEDDEGADDKKYCTCRTVSYGDMVACDNEACPYEWFHWSCVNLKSEPVGSWICPPCTEKMKNKA